MEKAELIKKWLDNNLSPEEQKAFEALEDYNELIQLSDALKQFKAPEFNSEGVLTSILQEKKKPKSKLISLQFIGKIAALLVISLGFFFFFSDSTKTVTTLAAQKITTQLPDQSEVRINAKSSIQYNPKNWDSNREIELHGEAYFKVKKGSRFTVITPQGKVTVLGTQFNVTNRNGDFEVVCYEGAVAVLHNSKEVTLAPGDQFSEGKLQKNTINSSEPSWINNRSEFKSKTLNKVLKEFENQYNIKIKTIDIDTDLLFTGTFVHDDIDKALQSITLPFNIEFEQIDNTIILRGEDSK